MPKLMPDYRTADGFRLSPAVPLGASVTFACALLPFTALIVHDRPVILSLLALCSPILGIIASIVGWLRAPVGPDTVYFGTLIANILVVLFFVFMIAIA